jgi:hypothetical protein
MEVSYVLRLLHHAGIGDVAAVSESYAVTTIRIKVCKLVSFFIYCDVLPKAGIFKSGYTAIASQRLRQTRYRCNGEVGY